MARRFEVVRNEPPVILIQPIIRICSRKLRETLDEYFPIKVYLIFGASEDKNIPRYVCRVETEDPKIIITRADHPRALSVEQISVLPIKQGGVGGGGLSKMR